MLELPEGPVERLNARSEGLGDLTVSTEELLNLVAYTHQRLTVE